MTFLEWVFALFGSRSKSVAKVEGAKPKAAKPGFSFGTLLFTEHSHFGAPTWWALTPNGLSINRAPPIRTPGEPATVRKIIDWWGADIRAACQEFGVPFELVVATIATEAGVDVQRGRISAETSERREPGFLSYHETPHRASVGLMHTLISTARLALGDQKISHLDLKAPRVSIRAGTSYIASQFPHTGFDPPLVAAAYNAGGLYKDDTPGNRWRLRCYPIGTGKHIDRFVPWFNDVFAVVKANPEIVSGTPSFVTRG
jgi:hypothetical protein